MLLELYTITSISFIVIGFESRTISLNESDTEYQIPIRVSSFSPILGIGTFRLTSTVVTSNASSGKLNICNNACDYSNIIGVDFEHTEQTFTYMTGTFPTSQTLRIRIKKDNIAGEGLEEIHIRLVSNPVNVTGLYGIHDLIIKIQDMDSKYLLLVLIL